MLYNYLHPRFVSYRAPFPFIHMRRRDEVTYFPETRMDYQEEWASLTSVNPLWCVLAGLGVLFTMFPFLVDRPRLARFRVVTMGAAMGSIPIFIVACITERYLFDVFPFLIVAGAVGLQGVVAAHDRSRWARILSPILVLLAIYTCYANVAISLGRR
jgi:hypothetical protein